MVDDFKTIQLPQSMIADLYKNNLVLETSSSKKNNEINFLGENKKHITIIHKDEESVFINEASLTMLTKLLGACKLTIADVAIVNIAHQPITFKVCKEELKTQILLMFSIESKDIQLPLVFPSFKIQQYNNCKILMGTSLSRMIGTSVEVVEEKKQLWGILKTLFEV